MKDAILFEFWFAVHNVVSHPLLVLKMDWTERFHDWTAEKMSNHH